MNKRVNMRMKNLNEGEHDCEGPPMEESDHHRGERIVFSGPNTNTNIIRVDKFDRIRIRILFVFFIMTEYEYEYYSGSEI